MSTTKERFYHPKNENGRYLDGDAVVPHVVIENPYRIPRILGLAGPGRCGSTALLFLLTGKTEIDRGCYQPLKTIIRNGGPNFKLYENDQLICVKEVFGPRADQEYYDPAKILLAAGVPFKNMTWIFMLRDPVVSFASWWAFTGDDSNPRLFARAQEHTLDLFRRYKELGLMTVPFAYDLLALGEEEILKRLLQKIGLSLTHLSLDFNLELLGVTPEGDYDPQNTKSKMVWGEALNPDHWEAVIKPIALTGRYQYIRTLGKKVQLLPPKLKDEVEKLCRKDYINYLELSKKVLGL